MSLESGNIKTIIRPTLEECKSALFELYGKAYHIEKRETLIKYGFLGLKSKEMQKVYYSVRNSYSSDNSLNDNISQDKQVEKNKEALLEPLLKHFQENNSNSTQFKDLSKQIDELTHEISSMKESVVNGNNEANKHESIKKIEKLLEENEFSPSYIRMISDKIRENFSLDLLDDFKLVQRYVVDWIGESIQISKPKVFRPPHVVIIIGPTGVGKTTTVAKLAANTILDAKQNDRSIPELCIFTIDTMRVGALEQLQKYGDALGKNVIKAETTQDVKDIYNQYKEHVDYIFVDTGGYSPNDATHIAKMKSVLDVDMNPDVYLAVSASTKSSDLQMIFRNYEPLAYDSVIVTKCDETRQLGNIISILWDKHKSLSYIADGQRVPRNIKKATIVDILINLVGFDIDRIHIEDKFGEQ